MKLKLGSVCPYVCLAYYLASNLPDPSKTEKERERERDHQQCKIPKERLNTFALGEGKKEWAGPGRGNYFSFIANLGEDDSLPSLFLAADSSNWH